MQVRHEHRLQLCRIKPGRRSGLLAPSERSTVSVGMKGSIRLALTGEILYEWDSSEVGELRVWELKQRFCRVADSEEYFAWQLYDDTRLLKDHHFVANIANNAETGLSLFAIKRRLRPPTLDEKADILYYVSICHRRKLWRLVSQGIEVKAIAGTSDQTCTLVRAIEANYVELSENYTVSLTQCKHSYGLNAIRIRPDGINDCRLIRLYGQGMTVQSSSYLELRPTRYGLI